ncbi:MAG: HAD-IA family hydrolase [Bacteroidales bacterium]|nr:HAD-IA family hydrolase [Bacteroidales bacterium]
MCLRAAGVNRVSLGVQALDDGALKRLGRLHSLADALAASGLAGLLDHVLSVDAVQIYKPRPEVYALAVSALGVAAEEIAFVSSNRWDIAGAAAFGFRPVWINRSQAPAEYDGLEPVAMLENLDALPGLALFG